MRKQKSVFSVLWLVTLLVTTLISPFDASIAPTEGATSSQVDELLANMTLRQKVGQLFMVSLGGTQLSDSQIEFLQLYQPGAVVLFSRNVDGRTPPQITAYVNDLQHTLLMGDGVPLFIATDHEGGRVQRLLEGFTHFPEPSIVGASADPDIATLFGTGMGREISAIGVNLNLAPVTDLHTREDMLNTSRVMNHRTISQDAQIVGEMVAAINQGFADMGVIGVAKHFPGHSPTDADSHRELATVTLDAAEVEATNLHAFQVAIDNGMAAIMVGHLYYPALEPIENLPATLSPTVLSILRDDMGFEGIIMTDALDMGAIVNRLPTPEASVEAFLAGVDMLTMGPNTNFTDQVASLEAVYTAVQDGRISEERLDASVRRILQLKADYGILDWQPLDPATTEERMQRDLSSAALIELFESGITVVRDENNVLPLSPDDDIAIIYPVGKPLILETCQQFLPDATYQSYSWWPYDWEFGATQAVARNADVVVVIAENIGWNTPQGEIVRALPLEKVMYVSLWKPYEWETIQEINPNTPGFMATYSTWAEAQIALCHVLTGQIPPHGQLPMSIDGYELGWRIVSEP